MSGDPTRLRDDPGAPDALRSDLAAVAGATTPLDVDAGLARLQGAIGTLPAAGTALGKAALLWGGGAGLAGVAILGVVVGVMRATTPEEAASPRPRAARVERTEAKAMPAAPEPAAVPEAEPAAEPRPRPRTTSADRDDRIAREIAGVADARSALASDPARALSLARQGDRDFPGGILRPERAAIAVLALDGLGRTSESRAAAERYLQRWPRGPFAERIRRIVDSSEGEGAVRP